MRENDTIFTLNARDNILLDVSYRNSPPEKIHEEINNVFDLFISSLKSKGIDYKKLKNCLIPSRERKEIALVFDIEKSGFSMHGYNTLKFNIIIEITKMDSKSLMKLLVALEYKPREKKLRLITMY